MPRRRASTPCGTGRRWLGGWGLRNSFSTFPRARGPRSGVFSGWGTSWGRPRRARPPRALCRRRRHRRGTRRASPPNVGPRLMRRRIVQLAALGLALIGYWLPWLTHPVAALRLNGYELSEWVTYLPGVRDGSLPLSRLLFLLPLSCLALLLGLAATWQSVLAAPLLSALPGAPV